MHHVSYSTRGTVTVVDEAGRSCFSVLLPDNAALEKFSAVIGGALKILSVLPIRTDDRDPAVIMNVIPVALLCRLHYSCLQEGT